MRERIIDQRMTHCERLRRVALECTRAGFDDAFERFFNKTRDGRATIMGVLDKRIKEEYLTG